MQSKLKNIFNLYKMEDIPYSELERLYKRYFSLGNLNCSFKNKLALISLICHLTHKLKLKKPDVTHYRLIAKLADGKGLPDTFIKALAIICDDFSYSCTEFITFDMTDKEMIPAIKNILGSYMPF